MKERPAQIVRSVVTFGFIGLGGALSGVGFVGFWEMFAVMMMPQMVFSLGDQWRALRRGS